MFKAAEKLKEKLKNREITLGTWITLGHSAIAEILANCPFEWLVIDMEHSVIELTQAQQMIQVISLSGKVPLVRLSDQSPTLIKRVMDAGAAGVIVPNVKTVEEARAAVAAVKYPLKGNRGVGLARAQGYGLDFKTYESWVNEGSIVIVQIEHVLGVENLRKILAVPGIDGIIIGPYDLSGSIDLPGKLDDPRVESLVKKIIGITLEMNRTAGFHIVQPDVPEVQRRIQQGFNFIGYSLDTIVLGKTFQEHLRIIRKQMKH
jgi:2-dehydro-3-deoxyglucarate aldolase